MWMLAARRPRSRPWIQKTRNRFSRSGFRLVLSALCVAASISIGMAFEWGAIIIAIRNLRRRKER